MFFGVNHFLIIDSSASFAFVCNPRMSLLFESVLYDGLVALKSSLVPLEDHSILPADFSTPVSIASDTLFIPFPINFGVLPI